MGCADYRYFETTNFTNVLYSIILPSTILMSCDERNIIY